MGRYLAAPCGTYATKVMDIKNNSDTNYIICDGGIHHLKYHGQTMAMQIPEMEVMNTSAETKLYCICGSLCTVADEVPEWLHSKRTEPFRFFGTAPFYCLIAERLKSEARHGRTILVITHDRELIESCCDNVVEVEKRSL